MQRRHHYEQALERYLRLRRIPYVAVDEARKALLPEESRLRVPGPDGRSLKSFDLVLYGEGLNLLVEVKGRKVGFRSCRGAAGRPARQAAGGRLECWATRDDIESLRAWERLFGPGFRAALVFVYWCDEQPPAPLFEEIFEFRGRWYAVRAVLLDDYVRDMRARSRRWGTVDLPAAVFEQVSRALCRPGEGLMPVATDGGGS